MHDPFFETVVLSDWSSFVIDHSLSLAFLIDETLRLHLVVLMLERFFRELLLLLLGPAEIRTPER